MDTSTEKQLAEFEALAKPLIAWLNTNKNPHARIIIDSVSAEVLDGNLGFHTDEFLKD
jgi:hypothetical protein